MDAAPVGGHADGPDRPLIRGHVALGIKLGGGRFPQHVVGIAKALFLQRTAVTQRFSDGLAGDKLFAHQLHGAVHTLADQRLAAFADQPRECAGQALFAGSAGELAGEHQAPDRGIDKQRRRVAQVRVPVAVTDLVANQRVARGVVGDTQQRLGHAHQRHAFLAGKRKLLYQCLDAAAILVAAQALHQAGGHFFNRSALQRVRHLGQLHQQRQAFRLGTGPGGRDGRTQRRLRQHVLRPVEEWLRH